MPEPGVPAPLVVTAGSAHLDQAAGTIQNPAMAVWPGSVVVEGVMWTETDPAARFSLARAVVLQLRATSCVVPPRRPGCEMVSDALRIPTQSAVTV